MFLHLPELLEHIWMKEALFSNTEMQAMWGFQPGDWFPSVILCSVLCLCCQHLFIGQVFSIFNMDAPVAEAKQTHFFQLTA